MLYVIICIMIMYSPVSFVLSPRENPRVDFSDKKASSFLVGSTTAQVTVPHICVSVYYIDF